MKTTFGGIEYEAVFNGFTPIAYSRSFTMDNGEGGKRPKDIAEAVGLIANTVSSVGMPAVTSLLEVFYACIRTADPKFDVPFAEWVATASPDDFDLQREGGWSSDVMGLIEDNFFPHAGDRLATEGADEPDAGTPDVALSVL